MHQRKSEKPKPSKISSTQTGTELAPLEALLACILDGYASFAHMDKPAHPTRVRRAHAALTGRDIKQVDSYDTKLTRALHRMWELRYEDYKVQLLPEYGGPPLDELSKPERSVRQLAYEACTELDLLSESNVD